MMTHTPLKFKRVWTQEIDKGLFLVKGLSIGDKTLYLKRYLNGIYDFVETPAVATKYKEGTASNHVASITKDIAKGKLTTYQMMDNRTQPDLLFVVLIDRSIFYGVFNRAERAEEACDALNSIRPGSASYVDISDRINLPYKEP